ncbi:MAG: exodeoxyribonuclease VII large subunit [Christensenellaceae bacterium]|nr:exodeoxyribonuclease VII large subunit [Christensenellaceae bacterium]
MNDKPILTVTEFCTIIKRIFQAEEMLYNVAVIGEISGYRASGAHSYFSLKDGGAVLPCSCFNYKKTYVPKEGEKVILTGTPDYYVQGGRFSFIVNKIEPQGIGALFRQIEELKKKLAEEGIFDEAHKKPIPKFPENVVVITSKSGAVIRDICRTVRRYNDIIDIVVKDVKVQGEFAVSEITAALKAVDNLGYDCCILARGGGSLEDLMPFYDERVVRAVYDMKTPIISAIGHETDFSLCDFAADARCATPTAAAELIAYDANEYKRSVIDFITRAKNSVYKGEENVETRVRLFAEKIGAGLKKNYAADFHRLKLACERMKNAESAILSQKEYSINKAIGSLDNLNPARILKSGYFRVYADNLPITDVDGVKCGDDIMIKGADGKIFANVTGVEKENI